MLKISITLKIVGAIAERNAVRCSIWYHFYNLKNVKNTRRRVLILVKVAGLKPATLLKLTLLHGCFSRFLNCTNDSKLRNVSQISQISLTVLLKLISMLWA